jgi:nucleoid DNA-binding protein
MMDMATPAKPSAPKAITTKHLAYALAEQHQIAKKQSLEMVEELIRMITNHLKKGERVKIAGLGILQVRSRAARTAIRRRVKHITCCRPSGKQSDRCLQVFAGAEGNLLAGLDVDWPRDGAIIFGDLIGKLDMLRVSCEKRGRDGCYGVAAMQNSLIGLMRLLPNARSRSRTT